MKYISLGTINKKLFFTLFDGVFALIANLFLFPQVNLSSYPCIQGVNAGIGLSLSFFPFLYLKLRDRKKNSLKSSVRMINANNSIFYNILKDKNRKKKYLVILLIAFLDFSQKFLFFFFDGIVLSYAYIFDTILLFIFSLIILKNKFYKHHFFSLTIMSIIGIIINIINRYEESITFMEVTVTVLIEVFVCLEYVLCKYVMEISISSPYEICFFIGLFDLILFSILLIVFTNIPLSINDKINHLNDTHIDDFYVYIGELDTKKVFIIILIIFFRCIYILFGYITVDYFTPAHVVLIFIIAELSDIFDNKNRWEIYLKIICFIIIFFFLLVFTEIIELNIFGLQKNTIKNIRKRTEVESIKDDSQLYDINCISNDQNKDYLSDTSSKISLTEYYL